MAKIILDENVFIRLYEKGLTGLQIGKMMGCSKGTVYTTANRLAAEGKIKCRNTKQPFFDTTEKRKEYILNLFKSGMSIDDMCVDTGLSKYTLQKYIGQLKQDGLIEYERKKRPMRILCFGQTLEVKPTLPPGKTVRCNANIARRCVYGKDRHTNLSNLCNFCLITGHCRSLGEDGCDYKACTKFSEISEDNPRIMIRC